LDCLQVLFCAFQVQFTKFTSQNNSEQTQQPHTTSSPSIITTLKTSTVLLNHPLHHQRGLIIITIHQSIKTLYQSVRFKPRKTSYSPLSHPLFAFPISTPNHQGELWLLLSFVDSVLENKPFKKESFMSHVTLSSEVKQKLG
jgi:hypothetical protein